MIKELRVKNALGESLPLTLLRPETSGLAIRNIIGLGPAKANVILRENSRISGSIFQMSNTPMRNVVLDLIFLDRPNIEAVRLKTYKYFPVESKVTLEVTTNEGSTDPENFATYFIDGYVESNEPSIFSNQSGCIISILCPDPFFQKEMDLESGIIKQVDCLFEFPFGDSDTFQFGELSFETADFNIENIGNVVAEPTIIISAVGGEVVNPKLFFFSRNDPSIVESLELVFNEALPALQDGEYIKIVTETQKKSIVKYTPSEIGEEAIYTNYLGTLSMDSSWPVIRPGVNQFSYEAEEGGSYIRISYEYKIKFSGI